MKILIVSPYLPAQNTSACARKVFDSIKLLRQRGHTISLISFCSEDDVEKISEVGSYCAFFHCQHLKDYSRYPFSASFLKSLIRSVCAKDGIDILQCEKAYLGRYIPEDMEIPCVLVEHEILSASFHEQLEFESNIFRKLILFLRAHKKNTEEKKWYRKFRKIVVFNEEDKVALKETSGLSDIEVIPLGLNLNDHHALPALEKSQDLIFVGNFSHSPNVDAMLYLFRQVLPLIRRKIPGVSLIIVGSSPPRRIKNLAGKESNISVTGYVENILDFYARARVFIAPIRYGKGMRFKILEAMAAGLPVVSTSLGARGIPKDNILIADTPGEFCAQVVKLLKDPALSKVLREKARYTIEKYFDLNAILDKYEYIYTDLLKDRRP